MRLLHSQLNIRINDLWASYQPDNETDWIIKDVNLDLKGCECAGIVGNNGSGKSTLAHALLGIIPHLTPGRVKGQAYFNDRNILSEHIASMLQHIGYSFQDVESQILFGTVADIIGINETNSDKSLINKAVDVFKIQHLLTRTPEQLSGGESQKVALITALRLGPELILYDEATSALDPQARIVFKELTNYLKGTNRSVILLGQRSKILLPYCDKMFSLKDGRIDSYNPCNGSEIKKNIDDFLSLINEELINVQPLKSELNIKNVYFRRKKTSGFKLGPIDIEIMPGETTAIVGPNGSGKTTFFYLISGLLKASDGFYYIAEGKPYKFSRQKYLAQNTFMATQSPLSQIIGTTIKEELSYASEFIADSPEKIDILLSHFPFLDLHRDPLQLSYGQQRLLTMICALLSSRPILLIDEPEQGLDEIALSYIKAGFMRNRQLRKKTVFFATHDLEFAASASDRCILFADGKIKSTIKTNELKNIENWYFENV